MSAIARRHERPEAAEVLERWPRFSPAVEEGAEERGRADAGDLVEADDSRFAVHAPERPKLDLAS